MKTPVVPEQYFQERSGVLAVARLVNDMKCVWRETPNADVGIDGQIELIGQNGTTTGQIVAAQVKSGASYFADCDDKTIRFRPKEKHRNYWSRFPIPVMVILHDPSTGTAFWADARQQLRSPYSDDSKVIEIPKRQELVGTCREDFFRTTGPIDGRVLEIDEMVTAMASKTSGEYDFDLSFLDLFFLGVTDFGRKLFFSMGLCVEIAQERSSQKEEGLGISIGAYAYRWLESYIDFLVTQHVIVFDYCDYLIDRDEQGTMPILLAPLTSRGIAMRDKLIKMLNGSRFYRAFVFEISDQFRDSLPMNLATLDTLRKHILDESGATSGGAIGAGGDA